MFITHSHVSHSHLISFQNPRSHSHLLRSGHSNGALSSLRLVPIPKTRVLFSGPAIPTGSPSSEGYRVISIDIPRVWNHHEWIHAFEKFLDAINVHHVHLYGTSLGGFLSQLFAQHHPRRVKSLVLSNTFLDTHKFSAAMPWSSVVTWSPSFLLKQYILSGIHGGPHEQFIADSVDFVVGQVETLSRDDLASRLTLNANAVAVGAQLLSDSFITIMDVRVRAIS